MIKPVRRLPSPSLVISVLALIVAVGGGTLAIAGLTKPKVKTIAKKQANAQITARAPGLSVAHADSADDVADVASARVRADGSVADGTAGVSVVKASTGIYCIATPFQPHAATVTIDENTVNFPLGYVSVPAPAADCGSTGKTNAVVFTFVSSPFASTPAIHDEPFHVILR